MRKLEIINKVSSKTGIDKSDVQETLEATLITIKEALTEGDSVYIRDFGTFTNKKRAKKNSQKHFYKYCNNIRCSFCPLFQTIKNFY